MLCILVGYCWKLKTTLSFISNTDSLQCFDTDTWASERTDDLQKFSSRNLQWFSRLAAEIFAWLIAVSTMRAEISWWNETAETGRYLICNKQKGNWISRCSTVCVILQSVFARDSVCCKRAYAIAIPSVCPSVRLSHGWISQKRLKLGSCSFHHTVAPSL